MDWKTLYEERKTTAEEAVKQIKSGDRVVVAHAVGESKILSAAMVANKDAYENVEVVHMVPMGNAEYCKPGMEKHFRHNSLFAGGKTRDCIKEGRGDFTPVFFSQIPELFATGLPIDVALVNVSPPNEDGECSLGVSVDYTYAAVKLAKIVIAQVNDQMPRTCGGSHVKVEDLDFIIEHNDPVIELGIPVLGEVEKAIGRNCASLINDGDTLQLGIGALPDAVLASLGDKKHLGIHSEMISDGVVDLIEKGVIDNSAKTLHKDQCVVSFLMGTKKLYDWADNNPGLAMLPVDYVNDPVVIMKNDNMISINSCVQVDLMGQVCSESVGLTQISAVGGQIDFVRGAQMSKGGKSIIAMPSTAAKGKVSKIVPLLDEGATVTTSRIDVEYIVTEYGIARLKGKTLRERARLLIGLAHPDFREGLKAVYKERFNEDYDAE